MRPSDTSDGAPPYVDRLHAAPAGARINQHVCRVDPFLLASKADATSCHVSRTVGYKREALLIRLGDYLKSKVTEAHQLASETKSDHSLPAGAFKTGRWRWPRCLLPIHKPKLAAELYYIYAASLAE